MKQSLMKFPNGLRVILSSRQSNAVTLSLSVMFGAEQEKKNSHFRWLPVRLLLLQWVQWLLHGQLSKKGS